MTFLEALTVVRQYLKAGDGHYICTALQVIGGYQYAERIWSQLGPSKHTSYEQWMMRCHPDIALTMTPNNYRQGRLRWLDHMIKEENQVEYERLSKWDRLAGLVMPPSAYGLKDYPA